MEAQVFERMAELDSTHWWFVARRNILRSVIERVVRPPAKARILEIGCGTGHNLAMLGEFGHVEASELDDTARKLAAKRLGRKIEAAALPDIAVFPEASYDLVALLDVLEHVADDLAALTAIRTRLKPGGKLLITVPANPWMWTAHDAAHHHHRRYTKRQLEQQARESKYEIDLISSFNTLLFPLIAAARAVGKVTGRESADDAMPLGPLNKLFQTVFGLESGLIGRIPMPFGVSLVAVLRRPE